MAQYIDKSALIEEIERRRESNAKEKFFGRLVEDNYLLDFLDTLEVKEVDDEPECGIFPRPIGCYSTCKECPFVATNNKAQKGE